MRFSFVLLNLCLVSSIGYAGDEPKFKVIEVIDGNTVVILDNNGEQTKILLFGIDCPDSGQNFAAQAKKTLTEIVLNKQVTLVLNGKDRYGIKIGEIKADGMPDPRYELVRVGLAWTTEPDEKLEALKAHARLQGLGLWIDENPMPPWMWRRHLSMLKAKSA